MITEHPSFQPPRSPEISIWRYMDLAKFLWLVHHQALYFCRADMLGDPYEGYYTEAELASDPSLAQQMLQGNTAFKDEAQALAALNHLRTQRLALNKAVYVNCWHMNEAESSAMWRLYTSHKQSVCIKSRYAVLAKALPSECMIGCVKYIDYRRATINRFQFLDYINHKRLSFTHENELRGVFWDTTLIGRTETPAAKIFSIDPNALIEEVFVSPDADDFLFQVVKDVCQKYDLNAPVLKSGVNAPPAY